MSIYKKVVNEPPSGCSHVEQTQEDIQVSFKTTENAPPKGYETHFPCRRTNVRKSEGAESCYTVQSRKISKNGTVLDVQKGIQGGRERLAWFYSAGSKEVLPEEKLEESHGLLPEEYRSVSVARHRKDAQAAISSSIEVLRWKQTASGRFVSMMSRFFMFHHHSQK